MVSSENTLNLNSKEQFFNNSDIPFQLKAGMVVVLSHVVVDYPRSRDGQTTFLGMLYDKDTSKSGKESRVIKGAVTFTFGVPSSMGENNCMASFRKFAEIYPVAGDLLDKISSNSLNKSDEEICKILADAAEKRFVHSAEGTAKNYEEFVADNFDKYKEIAQAHYPGVVSNEVYVNLKTAIENACKKKQITAQRTA